ncbi:helix-turn-helix transcriptional regulator [Yoonia sp. I 8.24]|uniref:ArsR/SmtB family transcription factor n=1 Tax=Yoonia sp. I 8.24 TaxID=1537229 RepID=UPI001EDFBF73|nr:metalloregulator ArsR/SmtB family transcription factor [Yoonia sp. I 8.24]MCG3268613.1 helix-turn-helix transcriptional regulator [Yoonia sp. I 8.24]
MDEVEAAILFGALSNKDRLKVIRALVEAGPAGMNAGDIASKIGASPSRASFHLAALAEAGFVVRQRQSRSLNYRVDFDRVGGLVSFLMEDCCMGGCSQGGKPADNNRCSCKAT